MHGYMCFYTIKPQSKSKKGDKHSVFSVKYYGINLSYHEFERLNTRDSSSSYHRYERWETAFSQQLGFG